MKQWLQLLSTLCLSALLVACNNNDPAPVATGEAASKSDVGWLQHGLTDAEGRYSELADINTDNVSQLGLAWYFDFPTSRGLEATPLIIDGVMYTSGSWSMVFAHDASSGELLWFYDPEVPRNWAAHLCCDVVNRGVAYADGAIIFGTLDGRLVSLKAQDGSLQWQVQTTDPERPYSITGAPRVVKDKVIIGNGGSELGVRGYVSAYGIADGALHWRFYTVPGNPEDGFENDAMARAAKTWGGGPWWEIGGGGTVWDSMAYDPKLNMLYIGVGNGSPWNQAIRSPDGGDNLFLSSIVALNPDDGSYIWHYQTTPGETWDYTATQHMILAQLNLGGEPRDVIMQAPKNGFFYVLDRNTGELLSADTYATVTWASHVDMSTGRPVENDGVRYQDQPTGLHLPGPIGGHNWHPMSYNPQTGLVYIPKQDAPWVYENDKSFRYRQGYWNSGIDNRIASIPDDPALKATLLSVVNGQIIAWDPVKAEPRWTVEHEGAWNGGMLSTAGNLLFQGNASGELVAYSADRGERLWAFDAQTGIVAPPVTFRQNGEQYIAVAAGWGGSFALVGGESIKSGPIPNRSRLLVFKLGGKAALPDTTPVELVFDPPELTASAEQIAAGQKEYLQYCVYCHGDAAVSGGTTPDLRALSKQQHTNWEATVLGGLHWKNGMVGFAGELSLEQAQNIHHYVIERGHVAKGQREKQAPVQ